MTRPPSLSSSSSSMFNISILLIFGFATWRVDGDYLLVVHVSNRPGIKIFSYISRVARAYRNTRVAFAIST